MTEQPADPDDDHPPCDICGEYDHDEEDCELYEEED